MVVILFGRGDARERWYQNYNIEIAEVVRGGAFER